MTTFVDSSIVIALMNASEPNHAWSWAEVNARLGMGEGPFVISDVVFAEISKTMKDVDEVRGTVERLGLERYPNKDEALFLAGRAYMTYKTKNKGPKTSLLPDFFIGAIAEVENAPLMTDNTKDFVKYFPSVTLIIPPKTSAPSGP